MLALSVPEDDLFLDDKADILDVNGFSETWQFALRPGQAPGEGLLAFLRLVNLSGAHRSCCPPRHTASPGRAQEQLA